ncbi:MAG: IS110 family transposase, partial [Gammaproteobacteria bacterium]
AELLALSEWLAEQGVTHIAMEATGVYWKPVWHVLEEDFKLVLANPGHIKNVPGRKTDVNDATWIAELLAHALIRASFVPEPEIQELRVLMRTRKQLTREQTSHTQRLQKTLEDANIKLDSVISDILGVSGRRMIEALITGESDPEKLAGLAHRRIKASPAELQAALHGRVTENHRFLLNLHLRHVDGLAALIAKIDDKVAVHLEPFRVAIGQLSTVPGIRDIAAPSILAEIGSNMSRFPSDGHLLAWSGLCPSNNQSADKRRRSRLRKGSRWLRETMIQSAWGAVRTKGTYYRSLFYRLAARMGKKKAICAVAASMLKAIYHMLKDGTLHQDLGADYFARRSQQSRARQYVKHLANLGYHVEITPMPNAA